MIITPLLHSGDKNLKEIQQIVTSTKAANLAKRAFGATIDLAMMAKKKYSDKQHATKSKANEKCFNCGKKGHYAKDCHPSNKKKPEESAEEAKRTQWKRNQANKAAAARLTKDHDDSDVESYLAGKVFMTRTVSTGEEQSEV